MHLLLGLIALTVFAMPAVASAQVQSGKSISEKQKPEKQITTFTERKEVIVKGAGDYTHRTEHSETNFRLTDKESHPIKVQPGDTLEKQPATRTSP